MKKDITSTTPTPTAQSGREMKGSDCVVECLIREGVDVVFAYPGGASQELHQSLARTDKIRVILPRHEQGGSFAAEGYARATGRVGVCMATSGPGATNLVSAIADAFMDSIPLIAITGQVLSKYIGKMAFQETDFFGMTLPIVKHSYLVMDANDLPRIFQEAFYLAKSGRPGPVVIDIPKDVQQKKFQPVYPAAPAFRSTYANATQHAPDDQLRHLIALIAEAKRPVLYAGGGIVSADAHAELKAFAEKTNVPVATTLMGVGAFPETHPLSMQWFGMHGSAYGNWAVDQSDLLLCFGARFDDRITGDTNKFATQAKIVHIDIDASEHNKNKRVQLPITSDIKFALTRLNELLAEQKFTAPDNQPWHTQIATWKKRSSIRLRGNQTYRPSRGGPRPLRTHQGTSHHHNRRGPTPDVGGSVLSVRRTPPLHQLARSRGHGLRLPRRTRGQSRLPRQTGHRYRRRWVVRHEHPGTRHRPHRENRRQSDDSQ